MQIDKKALQNIISDEDRLLFAENIPAEYLSDALGRRTGTADALVFALSTEEVSGVLRYANENGIPITPRGAGTNLVGSTIPLFGGIILDVSRMNRVLELDRDTMTVTVEPGMLLKDLQAYVEEHGLFYPPDPGEKASSIGGNISTNAGGMRAVKYGVTRDYVRGLEVVLADGTVLKVGGKQVKDASGLSLKHLLIGSEGTLTATRARSTRISSACAALHFTTAPSTISCSAVPSRRRTSGRCAVRSLWRSRLCPSRSRWTSWCRSATRRISFATSTSWKHPQACV